MLLVCVFGKSWWACGFGNPHLSCAGFQIWRSKKCCTSNKFIAAKKTMRTDDLSFIPDNVRMPCPVNMFILRLI